MSKPKTKKQAPQEKLNPLEMLFSFDGGWDGEFVPHSLFRDKKGALYLGSMCGHSDSPAAVRVEGETEGAPSEVKPVSELTQQEIDRTLKRVSMADALEWLGRCWDFSTGWDGDSDIPAVFKLAADALRKGEHAGK